MIVVRRLLLAALAVSGLACSQSPTLVSSHDFDRPTDMTFGCMGLYPVTDELTHETQLRPTGLPMSVCHPPIPDQREPDPQQANIARRTFGFVTNSARGELSVIDMDRSKLVDLDLAVAGFNPAPLGQLPEAAAISGDGCRLVTANRGSCDLTLVNPGLMMASAAGRIAPPDAGVPEPQAAPVSQTVVIRTGSGKRLAIAPYEVQFLPQDTSTLTAAVTAAAADKDFKKIPYCLHDAPAVPPKGWAEGAQTGWKALITFPACDLVALVDLPSGDIVDSVKVKVLTSGATQSLDLEHTGTEPTCPVECGAGAGTSPVPPSDAGSAPEGGDSAVAEGGIDATVDGDEDGATDADPDGATDGDEAGATADGGAAEVAPPPPPPIVTVGKGVGPLALRPEGKLAFVGLANAPVIAAIAIEPNTGLLTAAGNNAAGNKTGIVLNENAVGSARLRLSFDPYSDPPFLHGEMQDREYLYVIARDGTVRVVHVKADAPLQECETNVDPTLLAANDIRRNQACIPVTDSNRKVRRSTAAGPGIAVSGARDVAVIEVRPPGYKVGIPTSEFVLNGVFAMILTDSGTVNLVNLDVVPRAIKRFFAGGKTMEDVEPIPLANSLRDRNFLTYTSLLDTLTGPPRVDLPPVPLSFGPRLEAVSSEDSNDNPLYTGQIAVKTYVFFPDRLAVTPQTWSVSWEGDLISPRFTGRVDNLNPMRASAPDVLPSMDFILSDPGGGFCDADVHPGDVVSLLGCTDGNQCGSGQVCVHSAAAPQTVAGLPINGLCLTPNAATQETLVKHDCRRLLESVRRYRVTRASGDGLEVRPNLDELVAPRGDPNACAEGDEGKHCGPPDDVDSSHSKFVCHKFPSDGTFHCVNPCGDESDQGDADCRVGRKCVDFGAALGGRMCADAPAQRDLWRECIQQLATYRVQAGHSFLVQGSATAITLPVLKEPATGLCLDRPASSSPLVVRIPMNAPACDLTKFPEGLRDQATLLKLNTAPLPAPGQPNLPLALLKQRPPIGATDADFNPCLFVAGPNDGDDMATMDAVADGGAGDARADGGAGGSPDGADAAIAPPRKLVPGVHVRALFRNPQLQFILSNLEQQFTDVYVMRFDVHGGFLPQAVAPSSTVEVGLPTRLLISPLASPGTVTAGKSDWNGPQYMFVVDQRRLGRNRVAGGATRGQVLRINLQRANTVDVNMPLIIYDDYLSSGGLYPIQ